MTNKITLRTYQKTARDSIKAQFRNSRYAICRAPAGSGKTVIASSVINSTDSFKRVIVIAPEIVLTQQLETSIKKFLNKDIELVVETRQGLARQVRKNVKDRKESLQKPFDILICDEFHVGTANQNVAHDEFKAIFSCKLFKKILLLSATPFDLDSDIITKKMIKNMFSMSYKEAYDNKILNEVRLLQVVTGLELSLESKTMVKDVLASNVHEARNELRQENKNTLTTSEKVLFELSTLGIVFDVYYQKEIANTKKVPKTLIFTQGVDKENTELTTKKVKTFITKELAKKGVTATVVDLDGSCKDKEDIIQQFKENGSKSVDILVVCDMLKVGFDFPALEVLIDFNLNANNKRETLQKIGRIGRSYKGKKPSRYYYSMSLCDLMPIGGVSRELSQEVMSTIENTPVYANNSEEGRAAIRSSILEVHSIMSGSSEFEENENLPVNISTESITIDTESISDNLENCELEVDFVRNFKETKSRVQTVQASLFSVTRVKDSVDDYRKAIHLDINFSDNLSTAPGCHDVEGNYQLIREFIEKNNKLPSMDSKDKDEKKLSRVWSNYKNVKRIHLHKEFVNEITQKYPELFIDTVQQNYKLIREFIEKNNKLPSAMSTNKDEKKLGRAWSNYKTGKYKHLHKEFVDEITNKYPELFIDTVQQNYKLIREFIEKNNKLPSQQSTNKDEKKPGQAWHSYKNGRTKHLHKEFVHEILSKLSKTSRKIKK